MGEKIITIREIVELMNNEQVVAIKNLVMSAEEFLDNMYEDEYVAELMQYKARCICTLSHSIDIDTEDFRGSISMTDSSGTILIVGEPQAGEGE